MELPEGSPLNVDEAQSFIKSRKDRTKYNGLVEMKGILAGKEYYVQLLMSEGEIIGIEVKAVDGMIYKGNNALDEVKNLGGSGGELNLLKFSDEEMNRIMTDNVEVMLEKRVLLEEFKIKIRAVKPIESVKEKGPGMMGAVKGLFTSKGGSMKEFKGQYRLEERKQDEPKTKPSEEGSKTETESSGKGDIISRIKNRRFGRLTEKLLQKKKAEKKETEEEEELTEGKKVETDIDKLFNLLDKRDKLKINDALAKEMRVSKDRIEEWAVILEEHNLVTINYPAIGEPEITKRHENG